jgi:hypothetical protein
LLECLDLHPPAADMRRLVHDGMTKRPRQLPAWLLYDAEGSRLFEAICELPEYYPTRTEAGIFARHGSEIARISMMFAERHGERLGRELGIDHTSVELSMDGVKAGLGIDNDIDSLTYRELQARRDLIQKRMRDHVGR